ncbi:hypothetical protein niasHT_025144 [Heterodera trifolii]|uniref:AMP-dependent synthetase/ligase domain-containing protein n=1 Tax=Heterodera trifolii TaxID=157864 RepID=A0ABD2K1F8_9BILA
MLFSRDSFHVHQSFRVNELLLPSSSSSSASSITHKSGTIFDQAQQIGNAIQRQQKQRISHLNIGISQKNYRCQLVAIVAPKSAFLASMVIGVLKSGNAFAIFEPGPANVLERRFARFRIRLALFDAASLSQDETAQFVGTKFVDDDGNCGTFGRLKIGHFATNCANDNAIDDDGTTNSTTITDFTPIAYAIQTSGSTGIPKVVLVPFSAILPNVEDFIARFSIGTSSTVLFGTQTNFDPSLVELFVAVCAGAELVIPSSNWLFNGHCATIFLGNFRLTFVQLTPAVLQCLSTDILRHIFGPNSPIQSLLIGGDNFPLNLVKNHMAKTCPMAVFNVYGLTEVSCWASVHRFELADKNKYPHNLVPIGQPLMGTRLEIGADGILLIHGRRCAINFEQFNNSNDGTAPTPTGDIAFAAPFADDNDNDANDGGTKMQKKCHIFVRGRQKPNSMLPMAADTENEVLAACPQIVFAKLLYVDNCRFLFVDHLDGVSALPEAQLRTKLAKIQWPTRTFWNIDRQRRLTENGKIDEHFLRQFILSEYSGQISLQKFLEKRFGIVPDSDEIRHSTLRSLGIGSLEAAELAFLLQHNKRRHPTLITPNDDDNYAVETFRFLLDERHTLGQFLCKFSLMIDENAANGGGDGHQQQLANAVNDHDLQLQISPTKFDIDEKWAQNLGKCIDGTPIYHDGIVYAASHSGTLKGVHLATGISSISLHFPGDRFEAGCSVSADGTNLLAFGGFAGIMRVFDLQQPEECQHQPIVAVNCGAEIRMAPVFAGADNDDDKDHDENGTKITRLFWGSYDGHIWKLDITSTNANNGTNLAERRFTVVVAKFDASRHGFLRTNPLLIMISPNNQISTPPLLLAIFGTLNGTLYAVSCKEFNSILWSLRMDSPIFVAPITFIGRCLSLSVKGQLLLVEPENGHIISAFSALSNYGHQFFDSPTPLIGDVNQIDAAKQQQQQLLLISAGSNSLLLLSYNYRNESPTQSDYCKAAESNKGRCSVAAGGFSVLRRFLVPCQSAAGECIVRRPILFEQHQQRRFAFLLTNKGTLFRLWLDDELLLSLPSPSSLLPYPNPAGNDKDDSALPSPTAAAGGTVVARPSPPVLLLLDCVFTMDQQQLETFGHPLLLRHDNCCDYASSTTTMQHDDAVDDPPFVVVFGARDDLLRARFCVPRPRHSSQ